MKKGQISFEYLMMMGFVTIIIAGILSVAVFYTGSVKSGVTSNQVKEFSNKIISTAEYVFYSGEPSMATIEIYIPDGVQNVTIQENSLVVDYWSSGGLSRTVFPSNVNITGTLPHTAGYKKIKITATTNNVVITKV